ncbi:MAG TPA: dTDP-4-dehydrorhamnose 3,5-epimerase family protein [Candidatus Dojkabacteria bacterium]|jgi:dTDP-4-dehydrorhamnose 3,5-epimerase
MPKFDMPKETRKDQQTVTPHGKPIGDLPEGLSFFERPLHVDDRGSVCEMYDSRWTWSKYPLVFSYFFTIRPGLIKGWGIHKKHEDRYFVISGEMETVLYDARKDSKTYGKIFKIYLTEFDRKLMNIPAGIWHADRNIGTKDLIVVNFPTICYDHTDPDKYRLPLDTDKIPYKFDNPKGW